MGSWFSWYAIKCVRISKYKNIFANWYTPNWSEEVFVVSKIKNIVPWTYVINDLNGEEIIGTSYEKELQKTNQQEFRIGKVIKRKYDKLYAKWKDYDNSFNSWIDKKDLVWLYWMQLYCIKWANIFLNRIVFLNPFGKDISVKVDLSNYAKKQILKMFHILILQGLH